MKINRIYTSSDVSVFDMFNYAKRTSEIKDIDGKSIFRQDNIEVPEDWNQISIDILASKYFRKAGIHKQNNLKLVKEQYKGQDIPDKLCRHEIISTTEETAGENSIKQIVNRLAGCWAYSGLMAGYFDTIEDASAYYDEMCYILLTQRGAPNSPQFFNTGLYWAYGLVGGNSGLYKVLDKDQGPVSVSADGYKYPQVSACHILSMEDNLLEDGGIYDTLKSEATIFKHGAGAGKNVSNLRAEGEPLSGGGTSSGVMSFLAVDDKSAGSIKSGGITRRAAKMVVMDLDHPDIEKFIKWKGREELKVAALVEGAKNINELRPDLDYKSNEYDLSNLDYDFNNEAYHTVSGQNSNNSISIPNQFFELLRADGTWQTKWRTSGTPYLKGGKKAPDYKATELWDMIATAAHSCADPGLQFHTTTNDWGTCTNDGPIRASNPCNEFYHNDNTSCNLASINLIKYFKPEKLYVSEFVRDSQIWAMTLDISVEMSALPTKPLALGAHNYKTIGLGYANLGSIMMQFGFSYDSDEARTLAALITSIMSGNAYKVSNQLAKELGAFPRYQNNKNVFDRVLKNHAACSRNDNLALENISVRPYLVINKENIAKLNKLNLTFLLQENNKAWEFDFDSGFRNAQISVLAPCGTIGLLMDCDTTGVEPDFSLIKYKKLAGGGTIKIVNKSVFSALKYMKYSQEEIESAKQHVLDKNTIEGWKGFHNSDDLAIFDCAVASTPNGRCLSLSSHLKMMAAVQPFISGAISKTVNLPNSATVEDVKETYLQAWELGLKAIALYRDGCKLSQPLNTSVINKTSNIPLIKQLQQEIDTLKHQTTNVIHRRPLLATRASITHRFEINSVECYINVGLFDDGTPGELFITVAKQGSTVAGLMDTIGILTSICLQYGVPLIKLVKKLSYMQFEPHGIVPDADIRFARSIVDYVFRWVGNEFIDKDDNPIPFGRRSIIKPKSKPENTDPAAKPANSTKQETHQADAPICSDCGNLMVRNGSCHKCLNCGITSGCS